MQEAARASAAAIKEAALAMREQAAAVAEAARNFRHDVDASETTEAVPPVPPTQPVAPVPPVPAIPTFGGGKLVTGTLNGGGPEISVATINGDVTLRKLEKK
jgi:hypothetical protein